MAAAKKEKHTSAEDEAAFQASEAEAAAEVAAKTEPAKPTHHGNKRWYLSVSGHGKDIPDFKAFVDGLLEVGQVLEYARVSNEAGTVVDDHLLPSVGKA